MTWTAKFTVQAVEDQQKPIAVTARADADQVASNTEGKIAGMELTIRLDENSTTLKPGDEFHAHGHFDVATT